MPYSILVVEDDRDIAHLLDLHLKDAGYEVQLAYDGAFGLERILVQAFDLVLLDLMLPGVDGLELCRRIRSLPRYPPILMLTSRSAEMDRVLGLELGADDYLTKPFSIRELLARVKALFRRVEAIEGHSHCPEENREGMHGIMRIGDLVIESEKHKVLLKGQVISLTSKEFDLLMQFACHPGRVYTRAQLLDQVWGVAYEGFEHTVNSHINRLRTKIEQDPAHPRYLLTVWGVGYKFTELEEWKTGSA